VQLLDGQLHNVICSPHFMLVNSGNVS